MARLRPAMQSGWRILWGVAGVLFGALTLYLAGRDVEISAVGQSLLQASPWFLLLALGSVGVNTLAKALRWQELVGPAGRHIPLRTYLASLLVGQMLNTLIPARMGELSRAYVLGGQGPGRTYVLGTVMVEKILDLLAYAACFVLLLILLPLPGWVQESGYTFALAALAAGGLVFLVTYQERRVADLLRWSLGRMPARLESYLAPRLQAALRSLTSLQEQPRLVRLALWSSLVWVTAVVNNALVLLAFNLRLPLAAALLILVGLQAGISLPSTPGRVGIFEYICVLALSTFGVPQAQAFSYALVLHVIVLVPTTLLGVILFLISKPALSTLSMDAAENTNGGAHVDIEQIF